MAVDPLSPLAGSAHKHAAITLLICLLHTRRSMILQWLCCGSWPAALLCTFYLPTVPITNLHGCIASCSYNGYSLWPESGRPWEYLNSISDGLWKEGSLLAEIAQGCSSGTLQRKGWRVCGWSPEACQRRRKPVPWWIYSLFQPLQGDWYSLHGVHSTTKRDFTYGNFFSFLHWKQPFLILMKRSERTM